MDDLAARAAVVNYPHAFDTVTDLPAAPGRAFAYCHKCRTAFPPEMRWIPSCPIDDDEAEGLTATSTI